MPKIDPTPKPLPPVEYLRECFDYDHTTGELTWRTRPRGHFATSGKGSGGTRWNTVHAGTPASAATSGCLAAGGRQRQLHGRGPVGCIDGYGYLIVSIDGVRGYKAHRVIWKIVTGDEPPITIDHIDGDFANNRWANLRAATSAEQHGNHHRLHRNNTSGYRGVVAFKEKWRAQISGHILGVFNTREEAAAAYNAAATEKFGKFYHRLHK